MANKRVRFAQIGRGRLQELAQQQVKQAAGQGIYQVHANIAVSKAIMRQLLHDLSLRLWLEVDEGAEIYHTANNYHTGEALIETVRAGNKALFTVVFSSLRREVYVVQYVGDQNYALYKIDRDGESLIGSFYSVLSAIFLIINSG